MRNREDILASTEFNLFQKLVLELLCDIRQIQLGNDELLQAILNEQKASNLREEMRVRH